MASAACRAFQRIADADGAAGAAADGMITLVDLAATDIRAQARCQVGSRRDPDGMPIINPLPYVEHQVSTLGHLHGERHCEDVAVTA